jgi:hypothetical protein
MQMQDQRLDTGSKRRARFEAFRGNGRDRLAAARADAAMAVDAGDDRTDRRQIDVVVGVDVADVGRVERVVAMRASGECGLDDPVRVLGERTGDTGATGTGLLAARVRQVRLLALRRGPDPTLLSPAATSIRREH